MGRPTKLTEEAQDRFVRAVSAGVYPEVAARHAGFSPATLYRYLRGSTPEHVEFRERFERAKANLEIRLSGTVLQAAMTEPRWALALLERRFPERWRLQGGGSDAATQGDPERPSREASLVIDQVLVEELVPKLLEAGRALAGDAEQRVIDVRVFSDDGSAEDERTADDPPPASRT